MTPEAISTVRATAPALKEHGKAITQRMYEIAFEARPDTRHLFSNTWMVSSNAGRRQAAALAACVYAYAVHIDNPDALGQAIESIAGKHVNAKVLPETYPLIGECLLAAIKDVLGDTATPQVISAWEEAYGALAGILIERERTLYKERTDKLFRIQEAR